VTALSLSWSGHLLQNNTYNMVVFVRLSVRPVYQSKTVEVRIVQFTPYGSPIPLVFVGKFHPEILIGSLERGIKQGRGMKTSHFLALNVNIWKTVEDTPTVTINDNRKLDGYALLIDTKMTLDGLDLI